MCDIVEALEPVGDDGAKDDSVDTIAEVVDLESQKRLWLRSIVPLIQLRGQETDPSPRVQLALDLVIVAACERVGRILRSDLASEQG